MPQIREKEIKFHPRRVRGPSQAPSMHSCHTQFRLLASSSHPHHPSISSIRTRSTKFLSLPISSLSPCHCYSIGLLSVRFELTSNILYLFATNLPRLFVCAATVLASFIILNPARHDRMTTISSTLQNHLEVL